MIPTRIVEERTRLADSSIEVCRGYFAECLETGDIYCFGGRKERLDPGGQQAGEPSGWFAGTDGAVPRLVLPGNLTAGSRATLLGIQDPSVTEIQIREIGAAKTVLAGTFQNCLVVDTDSGTGLASIRTERVYAPETGLIRGDDFELVSFTPSRPRSSISLRSVGDVLLLRETPNRETFGLQVSSDLVSWTTIQPAATLLGGFRQTWVLLEPAMRYYRQSLATPTVP